MKLPKSAHAARPWRIHELTPDFEVEDVWALPTPGGPDDFPRLVKLIAARDTARQVPWAVRALVGIRLALGRLFGWDKPAGSPRTSLLARLPDDLRAAPRGPASETLRFTSLYLLDDEWALELANRTMHGVLHLGWVAGEDGTHRAQLAVLVKRNGLLGASYMAAIKPFRYAIVYPLMTRTLARAWAASAAPLA